MRLVKVAVACVNQTPFAWDDNFAHLRHAIEQARAEGVTLLCLPELAITGYGCEDAFFMDGLQDTAFAQLEALAQLTSGMVVAVGLPLYHEKALYDAGALLADGAIVGFVGKQFLAGDGIHYEPRWFKSWPAGEVDVLERTLADGSIRRYPIGDLLFDIGDIRIGFEICEDAWVANRPGTDLALRGADILCNPSASHFAFDKFGVRQRFVTEGSRAFGVVYLYANLMGNEAGRVVYDGGGLIASAGELAARGRRFSFHDVELTSAVVDIDANRREQARRGSHRPRHDAEALVIEHAFVWPARKPEARAVPDRSWEDRTSLREEEFARAVALGLWDYLRKSRAQGYTVSLSGGADSAACAVLVALAVHFAFAELGAGGVRQQLPACHRLHEILDAGGDVQAAVGALLACAYQPTTHSGPVTRHAAEQIARSLGAEFHVIDVGAQVAAYITSIEAAIGRPLAWATDDLTLQNIQARARAPSIWMLANLRGHVLLTTSNRSEAAVGYATMDGDTAGGLAPLGGIDKLYLRAWLVWMETHGPLGLAPVAALGLVNTQQPTAELRPPDADGRGQTDEVDLMPYELLEAVEDAAIRDKHTPLEVLQELQPRYPDESPLVLATWIERFFRLWCRNQWKRERLAPSFHLDDRNVDPRSWCRFPILSGGFERELAELRAYIASGAAGASGASGKADLP
ncbi:MAG TPA: nitrilase-related carbon-nitrogen hydrolase [Kofleriaceae bacterium]|jgi:NAD+ synthase (glutamine-hydrolysing)|nr:nitrilase-related carbon-nitrogen hydrolase [Kofleriaceae bacterium]